MHRTHLVGALLAALTAAAPAQAAVERTCGLDPVANTADVLCAAPSGPCDATTVVVGASIRITDGDCTFDLGGRALRVERTLEVPGAAGVRQGAIVVHDAGDITVAKHGRLKARGDLVRRGGIIAGGKITLRSSGAIRIAGTLDVSGDSAGRMELQADQDVVIERSAKIRGNGISSFADLGKRYADGGILLVRSLSGSVDVAGRLQLRGANGATGGDVELLATRDLTIRGKTDVSGGASEGGFFSAYAGDDLTITRAAVDARSRGGGGDGGTIWIFGGYEEPNDLLVGGRLRIDRAVLHASGSANDEGFAGMGGWIETNAFGPVHVSGVTIRADGATSPENPDGIGGTIYLIADGDRPLHAGSPPSDADLHVDGHVSARGGRRGGDGGSVEIYVGRDADVQATIDVGGKDFAGLVVARAGRDLTLGATLAAEVERPTGDGAVVSLRAGATQVGTLRIAADVRATGGSNAPFYGPAVRLEGCPITVADGVTIDGSGGLGPEAQQPALLDLISGRPLQLGAGSRYLAGPNGQVVAHHPPLVAPVIGPGAVFEPALVDAPASAAFFPTCPRCGDGPGDACGPVVQIDAITSDGNVIDASVAASSPIGLPLAGDVTVCDGTGIEDLTFTVLAESCDDPDPIELLVNDTVVATILPYDNPFCSCGHIGPVIHTVPLDDVRPLLVPGGNRLGIRKPAVASENERLYWAYATVTANGAAERVPLFDPYNDSEPFGTTHLDFIDTCRLSSAYVGVDAGGDTHLCAPVATTTWSGTLPCGLHVWPLEPHHDYTLVVRATDGVVAQPSSAAHAFTRGEEGSLMINGAQCPPP